jgi:hypothetical protein
MDCKSFARMLGSWMDGKLDRNMRVAMADHEDSCADCAKLHAERLALRHIVRSSKADQIVPKLIANIRESVLQPADPPSRDERAREP